jgi:hypothetical protein
MDWNFTTEPSPAVNNRSLHQAMGKALGGSTSINGGVGRDSTPVGQACTADRVVVQLTIRD